MPRMSYDNQLVRLLYMSALLEFLQKLIHQSYIFRWLSRPCSTSLDFCGQAALSIASRWHGEDNPALTYLGLIAQLRNIGFRGRVLELGGGYSTILMHHYLRLDQSSLTSVDVNPGKYDRILNSTLNKKRFLSRIQHVNQVTVTYEEALFGLKSLISAISSFLPVDIANAFSKYVTCPHELDIILNSIASGKLLEFIRTHPNSISELPFYADKSNIQSSFCSSSLDRHSPASRPYDLIFFDCGEFSTAAEWFFLSPLVPAGGRVMLHDIYYPKSIKNFLVAAFIELSPDWSVEWRETASAQGGLLAMRT
jgi:hypothetical protein